MNYVIIGNSAAGIAACEAIREQDNKGRITIISDEINLNYSRPLISYLLGKKISRKDLLYRSKDFYQENQAGLILNRKVITLDLKQKKVILDNKQKIGFDKLLLATGGKPFTPRIKGSNLEGVFSFTKLADEEKIEKYIKANKVKKAVIIGGGLIGLKATEALLELGISVSIVELADRILSTAFDKKASGIIESALEKSGCSIYINNTVIEIKGQKKVKGVTLKDKREINTDMVIIAIGVRPNIELATNTAIKTDKGILVDDRMQTSVKDVYAAGDCVQGRDVLLDIYRPIAILPVAVRHGKIAGYNMSGINKEFEGSFPMNSVELCGIPTISVGQTLSESQGFEDLEYFDELAAVYKKIVLKNDRIIGVIFVGNIERVGIYTGLIKDKVNISSFKNQLLRENFGLISLPQDYRKHLVVGEVAII